MTSLNQSIACWLWEFHRLWLPENPGPDRGMLTISTVFPLKDTVAFVSQFILMRPLFEGSVYYFGSYKHCNLAPLNFLATKHSDIKHHVFPVMWDLCQHWWHTRWGDLLPQGGWSGCWCTWKHYHAWKLTAKLLSGVPETDIDYEDPFADIETVLDNCHSAPRKESTFCFLGQTCV